MGLESVSSTYRHGRVLQMATIPDHPSIQSVSVCMDPCHWYYSIEAFLYISSLMQSQWFHRNSQVAKHSYRDDVTSHVQLSMFWHLVLQHGGWQRLLCLYYGSGRACNGSIVIIIKFLILWPVIIFVIKYPLYYCQCVVFSANWCVGSGRCIGSKWQRF